MIRTDFFSEGAKKICTSWCRFFFETDAYRQMKLLRIALGGLLLVAYAIRAIDAEFYYGVNGSMNIERMLEILPMNYRWSFLIWFPGNVSLWLNTGILLLSLFTMTIGFFPRTSAFIAYLLQVSFMHRNMSIVYGFDMISVFFLFYLVFAKTDSKPKDFQGWSSDLTSAALRMSQIQVCIIYAYSGFEKLKGPSWWKGEAIWSVFANSQIARWQLDWVSSFPLFISFFTYMTLLFEIYFPALVWFKKWRPWVLLAGVLLHLGIGAVVFIPFFAALMVVTYVTFLTPSEVDWIFSRSRTLFRPKP